MHWPLAFALFFAIGAGGAGAEEIAGIGGVRLGEIEAKLFYYQSGRLSDDVLNRDQPFIGWNTIIGAGDAEEAADDLLVLVPIFADGEKSVDGPIELSVRDKKGKLLGRRHFGSMLTSSDGKAYLALWLRDVGCAGEMTFHARFREQRREATLALQCGE